MCAFFFLRTCCYAMLVLRYDMMCIHSSSRKIDRTKSTEKKRAEGANSDNVSCQPGLDVIMSTRKSVKP